MLDQLLRKLNNFLVLGHYIVLRSHNLYSEKRITGLQNRNVQKLMRKAYKVPFYRARFDAAGLKPSDFKTAGDLTKFPLLTKEDLRSWIAPQVEKNPEAYKAWYQVTTSGSTGTPLMTCISPGENARISANWLRIISCAGIHPFTHKTMALKDPALIKRRGQRDSIVQKLGLLRRTVVSFLASGQEILEELNRNRPDFLYIQRSKLVELLMYAEKSGCEFHKPKYICIVGEGIDKNTEDLIEQYFSGTVFTSYGAMETGACTFTPVGDYYKHIVTRDTHAVNIVDDQNALCSRGRMIVTNLFLYKFPIINYDIGDGAEQITDPETGLQYLTNIQGKMNDSLFLADGECIPYQTFYAIMERRADILQFRVVQKRYDQLELQLVRNNRLAEKSNAQISGEIEAALRDSIQHQDIQYSFQWLDELLPDKNGKRRFVVSELEKK